LQVVWLCRYHHASVTVAPEIRCRWWLPRSVVGGGSRDPFSVAPGELRIVFTRR
jgi:hypothetical protein